MEFIKRWILEPIDDYFFAQERILQRFGWDDKVNYQIWKSDGKVLNALFGVLYNTEYQGVENIPNEGRAIVVCNYQSYLDPIVLSLGISQSESKRPIHIQAASELFETPIINAWMRSHFAFPLFKNDPAEKSYLYALELLEKDQLVGIFPEGKMNKGNGQLLPGHTGAVRLAYEANAPILPAAIYGTDRIYGKGAKLISFKGKIIIKFGKLMNQEKIFGKTTLNNQKFYEKATKRVMRKIRDLYYDIFDSQKSKTEKKE
ncbi:MAG: lysophospholipid acyltransferase family protein [Promethearchaeota archaeon]